MQPYSIINHSIIRCYLEEYCKKNVSCFPQVSNIFKAMVISILFFQFSNDILNSLTQFTNVAVETIFTCKNYFRERPPLKDLVTENMICIALYSDNQDHLYKLGAPLVSNNTIYGIYSWDRMDTNTLYVFTKVSAFSKWIKNW